MKKIIHNTVESKIFKSILLCTIFILINQICKAQPEDMGGEVDVPIDGGLSLLIAAGIGYGAKKLKVYNKVY